jgi:YVTN family beta-propeller protein
MATLVLSIVGTAVGAAIGGPIGATVGASIGSFAGGLIDNAILGVGDKNTSLAFQTTVLNQNLTSGYGSVIPIGYGTLRVGGNIIWASGIRVETITKTEKVRSGKFSTRDQVVSQETKYLIDMAVAILQVDSSEVEVLVSVDSSDEDAVTTQNRKALVGLRRIWMNSELVYDGRTFNSTAQIQGFDYDALYTGAESQLPDPYIESIAGVGNVPGFRGLAYILVKQLDIGPFGQRIPAINIEAIASLPRAFMQQGCEGIAEGQDGSIFLVSNLQRTVERIDPVSLKQISRIGANGTEYLGLFKAHPWRIATSGVDGRLWVTCKGDSAVQVINPSTNTIVQTIAVKQYPNDLIIDNSGNCWVSFPYTDQIARIHPSTYAVTYFSMEDAPWSFCKDNAGFLYVSCFNTVKKFNTSGSVLWTTTVAYFPWGLAFNHKTNEIWVACSGENQFNILSTGGSIVLRRNIGTYPTHVSIHPNDIYGSVAVTTFFGNQLKVYSKERDELLAYGTVSFPGPCLHLANGRVFVSQTKFNFAFAADGR